MERNDLADEGAAPPAAGTARRPPPLPIGKSERTGRLLFFGALAALFALLIFWPFPQKVPGVGFCAFRVMTGFPCGFCGGTRAIKNAVAGNWEQALYLNPVALGVVAIGGLIAIYLLIEALTGRRFRSPLKPKVRWVLMAVAALSLLPWTWWHAASALRTPKPELINLRHPVVQFFSQP
jgi:hypothetical protein